jgi:hypothetical protein
VKTKTTTLVGDEISVSITKKDLKRQLEEERVSGLCKSFFVIETSQKRNREFCLSITNITLGLAFVERTFENTVANLHVRTQKFGTVFSNLRRQICGANLKTPSQI